MPTNPVGQTSRARLYRAKDWHREVEEPSANPWRTETARDYGRIIHSACFRRLQGKTQLFPGHESDFFRNRLTHSLEVSQIAQAIADKLNHEYPELHDDPIVSQLCAVAGLVHDMGHPPFGHNGERALDQKMLEYGGFEGNAQTLRILSKIEKKVLAEAADGNDGRVGLNLTYRTLAGSLKYDNPIPLVRLHDETSNKPTKGYYETEADLVRSIKSAVLGGASPERTKFKTIECSIMDIADDIAYSTYDLEDCLKAGFLNPAGILSSTPDLLERVALEVAKNLERPFAAVEVAQTFANIFSELIADASVKRGIVDLISGYRASRNIAESGYMRTALSSELVNEFIGSVKLHYHSGYPMLSKVELMEPARTKVEVLKTYTFEATIYSARVKLAEYRGFDVVSKIFEALAGKKGDVLMPDDVREIYNGASDNTARHRVICDFVAGMTDRYALEFYARLHSDSAQSMFKPI